MTQLQYAINRNDNPVSDERRKEILSDPGFGVYHTDHMVTIEWSEEEGWHNAQVTAYAPIELAPNSSIFHYGQAIFEGIKAYRQADGTIKTFRPEKNARRMQHSAERLAMPKLPEEEFINSLAQLVEIDRAWVPEAGGEDSLYLRPFMFGTEQGLGVKPSDTYTYVVIASPAGAYFEGGVNPVSVWISEDYVRAAPGGTGDAKFAGNYAGSLVAQQQASGKGCDQVVWLDAIERDYIEELGGMNLFFVYGKGHGAKLVTPELSGSLLPGITRDSILQVAKDAGYEVEERRVTKEEWKEHAESGEMTETFACGTAAVITPVGTVRSKEGEFTINNNEAGDITMQLREALTGIQQGKEEDNHGWLHTLADAQ